MARFGSAGSDMVRKDFADLRLYPAHVLKPYRSSLRRPPTPSPPSLPLIHPLEFLHSAPETPRRGNSPFHLPRVIITITPHQRTYRRHRRLIRHHPVDQTRQVRRFSVLGQASRDQPDEYFSQLLTVLPHRCPCELRLSKGAFLSAGHMLRHSNSSRCRNCYKNSSAIGQ